MNCRNSRSDVFYEIGVPKFRKIHRKAPVLESLFKSSFRPQPATFFKKRDSGTVAFL